LCHDALGTCLNIPVCPFSQSVGLMCPGLRLPRGSSNDLRRLNQTLLSVRVEAQDRLALVVRPAPPKEVELGQSLIRFSGLAGVTHLHCGAVVAKRERITKPTNAAIEAILLPENVVGSTVVTELLGVGGERALAVRRLNHLGLLAYLTIRVSRLVSQQVSEFLGSLPKSCLLVRLGRRHNLHLRLLVQGTTPRLLIFVTPRNSINRGSSPK